MITVPLFARQMIPDYYGYPKDYLPQYQKRCKR
jgi:hypothetical protein